MTQKVLFVSHAISYALLILTSAIGFPIYCRWFYFLQIVASSGYSVETIQQGYHSLLNYLVFHQPFSIGSIPYSLEGQKHFADCRMLFDLNAILLLINFFLVFFFSWYAFKTKKRPPSKLSPKFFGAIILCGMLLILIILASLDFSAAFTIFHRIFFPGKENWIFDASTDPVITILPQTFFMNCAIAIAVVLFLEIAVTLVFTLLRYRRHQDI